MLQRAVSGLAICISIGVVLTPPAALALPNVWTGTVSSDWFAPPNWSLGTPTSADDAIIDPAPFNPLLSAGTASVTGLTVGDTGTAKLDVFSNGVLDVSGTAIIGENATANGTLTVSGTGSAFNVGELVVGDQGTGSLLVQSGATATADDASFGASANSSGTATLDGAGSSLTITTDLTVGGAGSGTITVQNGSVLNAGSGTTDIGALAHSAGDIIVDGAGSAFNASSAIVVGDAGLGGLSVDNGGVVNAGATTLGLQAGSAGFVHVDGAGSQWIGATGATLIVGDAGGGDLSIGTGGAVLTDSAVIGNQASGNGSVSVVGAGSVWTNANGFIVGDAGSGTLTIQNGGAEFNGGTVTVGAQAHATGAITVDGAGSSLAMSGTGIFQVGYFGTGSLSVTHGGTVAIPELGLGIGTGSSGTMIVDGAGSTATTSGLLVGFAGSGAMMIFNGGTVVSSDAAFVGSAAGGSGLVTVNGAGSSWTGGVIDVGLLGDGVVTVLNGGAITATTASIGVIDTTSVLTLIGQGSSFTAQDVTVGEKTGANGAVTVSDGAAFTATNSFTLASDISSVGILNIGNSPAGQANAPGTFSAPSITFGAGTGTINFNHTSDSYVFSTPISGAGTLNQVNGTTILTGDDSAFTGQANISGGTLLVNTHLGTNVLVLSGGTLGGDGSVAGLTAQAGSTIAPGSGTYGTLTVNGNFEQDTGSTYQLDLAPDGSDFLKVTGTADIAGGTVYADKATGFYAPGTHYTILTAAGGVTGTYDTLDQNAPFVDLSLHYDAHDVYLDVAYDNTINFCDVAVTRNQCATGNGAQSLGPGSTVFDAIAGQATDAAARHALDLLSGEVHASLRGALVEDGTIVSDLVTQRIRSAFGGVAAEGMPVLAYGEDGVDNGATAAIGGELAPADTGRLAAWGSAFGEWGHIEGDGNAAGLSTSTGGFLTGIDGAVGDDWRVGVMTGYSQNSFNDSERASSGDAKSWHLGVYGGTHWDVGGGSLGFRAGAAYSWHDISTSRDVVFPGMAEKLSADYDAGATQLFGELGYDIKAGQVALEPFAGLAYVGLHTDGFAEKGGAAALTGAPANDDVTFTTLGLRASEDFTLGGMTVTARGTLGWRHAFGDTTPLASFSFAGSDAFAIAGAPIGKDAALVEAGFDVALTPQATLGFDYRGQLASKASENGFDANLAVRF